VAGHFKTSHESAIQKAVANAVDMIRSHQVDRYRSDEADVADRAGGGSGLLGGGDPSVAAISSQVFRFNVVMPDDSALLCFLWQGPSVQIRERRR
ncbi:MAG: hypothetical protein U1D97_03395, partial [Desulfuromonadales bacterium]|nr:hypothetical protein [Desulfuromonadales bacterium]